MKINPIGINAYQQISRTNNTNRITNANTASENQIQNLTIKPRQGSLLPRISLSNGTANQAEALTLSERTALEHVINAIKAGGSNNGYSRVERTADSPESVGRIIDVKV